jgi:hypothetical protein
METAATSLRDMLAFESILFETNPEEKEWQNDGYQKYYRRLQMMPTIL